MPAAPRPRRGPQQPKLLGALGYNVFASHGASSWTIVPGDGIHNMSGVGAVIGSPMMTDSNGRGAACDPVMGIRTSGDNQHRDAVNNLRFARTAAPVIARAIGPLGRADALATIPPGIPTVGGPRISRPPSRSSDALPRTKAHGHGTGDGEPKDERDGAYRDGQHTGDGGGAAGGVGATATGARAGTTVLTEK